MKPGLLLSAARAHSGILLSVIGATVLLAALVSLLMPKTYLATAGVLVDSKNEQSTHTAGAESRLRERISFLQTQVDIITSQKVARKVVLDLGLANQPGSRAAFDKASDGEGAVKDWLAGMLLADLKVDATQNGVIHIAFASGDAQFSARVANAFAKAYLETALELRNEPLRQSAAWLEGQIKELRANLEKARAGLRNYEKDKGLIDERLAVENLALADLANEVVKAESRLAGISPPELPGSWNSRNIRSELLRSENKLREMAGRLGTNHPAYQRQLAETQRLRALMQAEMAWFAVGPTPQNRRVVTKLRTALETQQAKVLELKANRNQLAVLARDAEIARKAYETAMQHSVENRVESGTSLSNISVLHAAVAPFAPARPRILLNIASSMVIGTMLGLCIVCFIEMPDHRVRVTGDLDTGLPVPVLAEIGAWQPEPKRLPGRPRGVPALPSPS